MALINAQTEQLENAKKAAQALESELRRSRQNEKALDELYLAQARRRPPYALPFASRSVRRALLTPQVNPGSLYSCGESY